MQIKYRMLRRIVGLAMVLAVAVGTTHPASAQHFERLGNVTYFGAGGNVIDVDGLSSRLEARGYGALSEGGLWAGTANATFIGRFVLGADASRLRKETRSNADFTSSLSGTYGTFNLGYVLVSSGTLRVYPYVGAGYGSFTLQITEDDESLSFDQVLDDPRQGASLKNRGWLINAGAGADYLVGLRRAEERVSGLAFGVRGGYLFTPKTENWEMMNAVEIAGNPDLTPSGPYFRVYVGFGYLLR